MSEFVQGGFVADDFVGEGLAATYVVPTTYATDFREYRRGRMPADWTSRWEAQDRAYVEGAFIDAPHRSAFRLQSSLVGNSRALYTWDVPDLDPSRADIEVLALVRAMDLGVLGETQQARVHIRASGVSPNFNSYQLLVAANGSHALRKLVNDVPTNLATFTKAIGVGTYIWVRLRATGTAIKARIWADGDAEPGTWDASATDATHTIGWCGLESFYLDAVIEYPFFAVGTAGSTAPPPSVLGDPFDKWISRPDEIVDLIARFEYFNPNTGLVEEKWESTYPRPASPITDYPAGVAFSGLLLDAGTLTSRLEADAHLGGASLPTRSPIRLNNVPGQDGTGLLDAWVDYSFYGRPVEIRAGRRWAQRPSPANPNGTLTPLRSFEIIGCSIVSQEPDIGPEEVTLPLGPPTTILNEAVRVYRNIGIPTGIKSLTALGWLSIPTSTAYEITSWVLYMRVKIPTGGVPGSGVCNLSRRQVSSTRRQWHVALYQASTAFAVANKIHFIAYRADGTLLISQITPTAWNVARYIDVIFGVRGTDSWYAYVDGIEIGAGPLSSDVDTAPGQIVEVLGGAANGVSIVDHRIEKWVPAEEALARYSARREPDAVTISMHRCDESSGATVTDYATLANHGTLQGTDVTDRIRVPTYLGSAELVGVPMPMSAGVLFHAPTQTIDPVRNIYRYNDRPPTSGTGLEVRSKGLLLAGGGVAYTSTDEPGTADMTAAVDEPVTYGLPVSGSPESENIHIPQLIRNELVSRGPFDPARADLESFDALRKLLPLEGGFHYPEAPTPSTLLGLLGSIGAYYGLDRDARVQSGCLTPPINPGPYGTEPLLEFLAYPDRGVTFSFNTSYALNQTTNDFSLNCWFKFHAPLIDPSTSSTFTHFPKGYTLIDCYDEAAGSGFYLGFDGRNGDAIFATPGLTASGRHYIALPYAFQRDTWYWLHGEVAGVARSLNINIDFGFGGNVAEAVVGTWVPPSGVPLKIGHGYAGSFPGSIAYVIGASPRVSTSVLPGVRPTTTPGSGTQRFHVPLTDATGDLVLDRIMSRYGRVDGARWCPKMTFDFRKVSEPQMPGLSRSTVAWRTDARYKMNRSPLVGTNVAGGVSTSDRVALSQPTLSEADTSEDIRATYLGSRDVVLQTPLLSLVDADLIARILRDRLSPARRLADAIGWYRQMLRLGMTDEVLMYHDRFSPDGYPMRVATLSARLAEIRDGGTGVGDIGLWG